MADTSKTIRLRIRRQDAPGSTPYWESFEVAYQPMMNVISVLQEIQKNPVNTEGKRVLPVVWECSCLEEICGACTMIINGRVRQACSALIDEVGTDLTLEPVSKFPVVRDLMVDRQRMFEAHKKVKGWVEIDGTHPLGPGPRSSPAEQQERYPLSKCMTCGCCCEACPNYVKDGEFLGPFAMNLVRLFNSHPTGHNQWRERIETVMGRGGIANCGKSQNCVEVCPKEIPLIDSLAAVNRQAVNQLVTGWILDAGKK
jgi:succinate dehydrogenase / fumarate reductase iron-sulfur subunit